MKPLQKTARGVFKKHDIAKAIIEFATRERRAKLLEACADNNLETVNTILDADPTMMNIRDDSGWTLLHIATGWCAVETVETLLLRGANPESPDATGQTSRALAHQLGFDKLAEMMDNVPSDAKAREAARAAKQEKEALSRDIQTITTGLQKPCCVHKRPLTLKQPKR